MSILTLFQKQLIDVYIGRFWWTLECLLYKGSIHSNTWNTNEILIFTYEYIKLYFNGHKMFYVND